MYEGRERKSSWRNAQIEMPQLYLELLSFLIFFPRWSEYFVIYNKHRYIATVY